MQLDVHDTKRRIERAVQLIKTSKTLPDSEKEKILKFDEYLAAKGIGEKRRLVYLVTLPHLRLMLGKNYRAATKQDLIGKVEALKPVAELLETPAWVLQDPVGSNRKPSKARGA